MPTRKQQLLTAALGVGIWGAALNVQAALIFDGLRQTHTIAVVRQGQVVTSVTIPSGATLNIDAESLSTDKTQTVSIFRGNVRARVKLEDEIVFSISADEMRLSTSAVGLSDFKTRSERQAELIRQREVALERAQEAAIKRAKEEADSRGSAERPKNCE